MPHFKIAVMGPDGVGKTALTERFLKGRQYVATSGPGSATPYRKQFDVDGVPCIVDVIDAGVGKKRKRESMTMAALDAYLRSYETTMRAAHGFLLVFSLTQRSSLDDIKKMHENITRIKAPGGEYVPAVFVGNKLDLDDDREITHEEAEAVARECDCIYIETSTRADINVLTCFEEVVRQMRENPLLGKPKREHKDKCRIM